MVTSSTVGWSGHRASSSRRTRDVVLLPTATLPATPITNGGRAERVAEERRRDAVPLGGGADLQVEQPGQREVDLLDLGQVDRLAEAAQPRQVVVGEGEGRRGPEVPPLLAVDRRRTGRCSRVDTLAPMCGIVGYVGDQSALEVVVEGLRRLEYRGYDSAGVALLAEGGLATAKRAGKLANLDKALADEPLPPATTGIGHTRWATHGAPNDRNAHPHVDCTGSVAVIHNGIIENFAHLRAELEERGHQLLSDTDTEAVAHLLEEATRDQAAAGGRSTWPRRCARSAVGSRGPSPSWRPTSLRRTSSSAPAATHRWSPAAATARTSWPPTWPPSSRTPATRSSSARTRSSRSAGTRSSSPTSTATRARSREYHVDWDLSAAEKGGYDYFMLKEIAEQPQAVADTLLGRLDRRRPADARRDAAVRRRPARGRQDHRRGVRHGVPRRPRREVRHRALDPHPVRGRARLGVPLPRPGADPVDADHRHLAVRRDDGHPDGAAARARAAARGSSRSATPTARPSRASPTPCSTPTPVPRSPSRPPRAT